MKPRDGVYDIGLTLRSPVEAYPRFEENIPSIFRVRVEYSSLPALRTCVHLGVPTVVT